MRCSGFIIAAAAAVTFAGCRCDKAREQQTATPLPSASQAAPAPSTQASSPTGESSTRNSAGAVPVDAEAIVIVRTLDFAPVKGSRFLPTKLRQDGLITRKDEPVAKIEAGKLTDDKGRLLATFVAPAQLAIESSSVSFTFNERDQLEGPDGLKIAVDDSGIPTVSRANEPPEKLTGKFVDFDPKARRAAAILLAIKEIKKAAKEARPKAPKSDEEKDHKKKHKKKGS
ncbi:MAG TPA: hypothetical protein VKP30_20280 [Polyangiaceae bacterium]|nr:hypothetical protein [Polyangiaceae bacterium]